MSKMEIFQKEVNRGKLLIIYTMGTVLDVAGVLQSIFIFAYISSQYKIPVP